MVQIKWDCPVFHLVTDWGELWTKTDFHLIKVTVLIFSLTLFYIGGGGAEIVSFHASFRSYDPRKRVFEHLILPSSVPVG